MAPTEEFFTVFEYLWSRTCQGRLWLCRKVITAFLYTSTQPVPTSKSNLYDWRCFPLENNRRGRLAATFGRAKICDLVDHIEKLIIIKNKLVMKAESMHNDAQAPQLPRLQEQPHQEQELFEADNQIDHSPALQECDILDVYLSHVSWSKFTRGSMKDGRDVFH